MLQFITNWLNSSREYFTGVVLYKKLPACNNRLVSLLEQGPTDFSRQKLVDAMRQAFVHLTAAEKLADEDTGLRVRSVTLKPAVHAVANTEEPVIEQPIVENPELHAACKLEADNLYKEVMNMRAELFALTKMNDFVDPNLPDRINARQQLAIDVVKKYKEVSQLYDKADHVKQFGRLPDSVIEEEEEEEIPDVMVKQTLDNLRKNYNKIKNRQPTAERVALMQKHESTIKKLEARWLLLKQQN